MKLPPGRKAITNKWVFKKKSENVYKARLVAKGYSQKFGRDNNETFSPVAQYKSIRMILALAAKQNLFLAQFDVKTAFLNGNLDEEIFMKQPEGFDDSSGRVCLLKRSLYGLKQSARCWNFKFVEILKNLDLTQAKTDPCIFIKNKNELILVIWVDDGLIAAQDKILIENLLEHLEKHVEIKREIVKHFLGMEISRKDDGSIFINQQSYIENVLETFNMQNCKEVSTPGPTMDLNMEDNNLVSVPYREAIGKLLFLASVTRPDIAYATNQLSSYMESPRLVHWEGVKRIFRYLKGTKTYGLYFQHNSNEKLNSFSDADFAGDTKTRKSTSGFVITLGETAFSWFSKRQTMVALSTAEAEYIAAADAVKEIIVISNLAKDLGICEEPITLHVDNQSAIRMILDESAQKRTKHIDIRFHFIKDTIGKQINVSYVQSQDQLADMLTKSLTKEKFKKNIESINVISGGSVK